MLASTSPPRRSRRRAHDPYDNARVVLIRGLLRAAAARAHQDPGALRLLHRRRRHPARCALDRRATSRSPTGTRSTRARRSTRIYLRSGQPRPRATSRPGEKGARSCERCARRRRGGGLRGAELLRPRAARAADAEDALDARRPSRGPRSSTRRTLGQFQVIREQAGTFADSIKLWSEHEHPATASAKPTGRSMAQQKEMIAGHFTRSRAKETGRRSSTPSCPATSPSCCSPSTCCRAAGDQRAAVGHARQVGAYITEAEKLGHSEDVCTYVKCDIGMLQARGNIGPDGHQKLPEPDLLLLSYTGCFTFMKWFELLREEYKCPVAMLHVPYQGDGTITPEMREYVVDQLKKRSSPPSSRSPGKKLDEDDLAERSASSARPRTTSWPCSSPRHNKPRPSTATSAASITSGRSSRPSAAPRTRSTTTASCAPRSRSASPSGSAPSRPTGPMNKRSTASWSRARPTGPASASSGRCSRRGRRRRWRAPTRRSAGLRPRLPPRPERPLETLAEYCLGCYTNLNLPTRIDLLEKYVKRVRGRRLPHQLGEELQLVLGGAALILREVEKRTGVPGGFIESDLVDPRYFSARPTSRTASRATSR
jgi:benzoyl-CoA reductase subunit B